MVVKRYQEDNELKQIVSAIDFSKETYAKHVIAQKEFNEMLRIIQDEIV